MSGQHTLSPSAGASLSGALRPASTGMRALTPPSARLGLDRFQVPSGMAWKSMGCRRRSGTPVLTAEDILDRMRRVEAVLFLTREPLTSRRISELADLEDGTEARTLIRRLNRRYDQVGRAFRAEPVAGGYQLMTRSVFVNWLRKLSQIPKGLRLSQPAYETLTVVAYRQPVIRAEVEAIRGVACGELLKQLMERDLVKISGRSEELGRPFLYSTTKHFLKTFGLNNLDALPRAERIRRSPGESAPISHAQENAFVEPSSTQLD